MICRNSCLFFWKIPQHTDLIFSYLIWRIDLIFSYQILRIDLIQDSVEGAVFLGNRGGRRRFTAGFSSQGTILDYIVSD